MRNTIRSAAIIFFAFFIIFSFAGSAKAPEYRSFGAACIISETESYCFESNLSAYEKFMNPQGDEFLILINKENPVPYDYEAKYTDDLVSVINTRRDGRGIQELRSCAAYALKALFIEAEACGINIAYTSGGPGLSVTSAYRSYNIQKMLFDSSVRNYIEKGMTEEEALRAVQKYIAPPGSSEHQSGLAVDMHNMTVASVSFAETAEYKWLENNSHKFGFIIRYPRGKENITGISFEPWHFRFAGRKHATAMKEMNMCLEEYTVWLKDKVFPPTD